MRGLNGIHQGWRDTFRFLVACRDLRCETGSSVTVGEGGAAIGEPELTPDGRTVLFGWSREGALAWEAGSGFAPASRSRLGKEDSGSDPGSGLSS